MSGEEKAEFMSNLSYYWYEKGRIGGFTGYSIEAVRECDQAMADAIERYESSEDTINRLMER